MEHHHDHQYPAKEVVARNRDSRAKEENKFRRGSALTPGWARRNLRPECCRNSTQRGNYAVLRCRTGLEKRRAQEIHHALEMLLALPEILE